MGIDILSPPIQMVLHLIGVDANGVPIIDGLRQSDYRLGQVEDNFPARMVGGDLVFMAHLSLQPRAGAVVGACNGNWLHGCASGERLER